jgi:hypothetical protein
VLGRRPDLGVVRFYKRLARNSVHLYRERVPSIGIANPAEVGKPVARVEKQAPAKTDRVVTRA